MSTIPTTDPRRAGMRPCQSMDEVRAEIDRLDALLVPLVVERLGYVAQAAGLKPTRDAVVVPWRIEDVVAKARLHARHAQGDEDTIERIWRALVDISIDWERAHFDRLRLRGTGS
ncbi:chorismate mutase [Pararhodospirillum oryzae]|uniref:chorismate mutase n=1 Tax=Pararhodospirillum oryzae TaxID=478448 RepID=A0A512H777_9PROT|nr:chorismate mutase [Pararhodospirillum oryzae]GEO81307.1 chorismate mutase [Pararhodospirillum oryzae]